MAGSEAALNAGFARFSDEWLTPEAIFGMGALRAWSSQPSAVGHGCIPARHFASADITLIF
ncbi:hypothetical protein V474_13305 [Novosphingobium barchaimii LL02]|uniref:Uncharacterized protein n=1 Tax=Novosphingobium barchaimii LL02 TaxID=1114963 RepID=A0A0J8AQA0_9SPHN|nr:hypothetical protein V474_13305 [Novosphingobium barchaimii LL02]